MTNSGVRHADPFGKPSKDQHATVLGLLFGFHVDGHHHLPGFRVQRLLDTVGDRVRLAQRHLARNDDVALQEGNMTTWRTRNPCTSIAPSAWVAMMPRKRWD